LFSGWTFICLMKVHVEIMAAIPMAIPAGDVPASADPAAASTSGVLFSEFLSLLTDLSAEEQNENSEAEPEELEQLQMTVNPMMLPVHRPLPLQAAFGLPIDFDLAVEAVEPQMKGAGSAKAGIEIPDDLISAPPEKIPQSNGAPDQTTAFTARITKADKATAVEPVAVEPAMKAAPRPDVQPKQISSPAHALQFAKESVRTSEPVTERYRSETNAASQFAHPGPAPATERPADTTPLEAPSAVNKTNQEIQAPEPVRQMSVELEGTGGQIRLRVEERSGEMRAWVTGKTPETVERVQAGLSDLTQSLNKAGLDSEIWAPNVVHAAGSASELQASTEHSEQNLNGGFYGSGSDERGENQRRRESQSDDEADNEHSFRSQMRKF
jgi:hypothetical protein